MLNYTLFCMFSLGIGRVLCTFGWDGHDSSMEVYLFLHNPFFFG